MKLYKCENDYCNKKWYDDYSLPMKECPYCGCKFLKINTLPDPKPPKKRKKKKNA